MSLSIGILLTVVLIVLLVLSKRTKTTSAKHPSVTSVPETTTSKFHAVSIQATNGACDAAKSMQGKRYLSNAAPRIPLPDCDATVCRCRFLHHADRRSGTERRGQVPDNVLAATSGYTGKERRYRGDRRGSDEPRDFFV